MMVVMVVMNKKNRDTKHWYGWMTMGPSDNGHGTLYNAHGQPTIPTIFGRTIIQN